MDIYGAFIEYKLPASVLFDIERARKAIQGLDKEVKEKIEASFENEPPSIEGFKEMFPFLSARLRFKIDEFLETDHHYVEEIRKEYEQELKRIEDDADDFFREEALSFEEFAVAGIGSGDNFQQLMILFGLIYGIDFRREYNGGFDIVISEDHLEKVIRETDHLFEGCMTLETTPDSVWLKMWDDVPE